MENLIKNLKALGLNEYEAKVYVALVELGAQKGREVSKNSGVPPTRVFDVLKSLQDKGLVNLIHEKPMIWVAVKPSQGIKWFVESKTRTLEEIGRDIVKSMKEIRKTRKEPKIHERIVVSSGYRELYNLVISYLRNTKRKFFVYSVGEEIPFSLRKECKKAKSRGVELRLIVTKFDEENKHIIKERIKEGWKVKHYPSSGEFTFAIFDSKVALINIRNPKIKEERITIVFENSELAKALMEYYKKVWRKAKRV